MEKIKVGVVGVGHLGEHHTRVYAELEEAELVAVVDVDQKRARKLARKFKTQPFSNYREIIDKVSAVSIVVPTSLHYPVASDFLKAGVHCLIEKPITTSLKEAEELLRLAREKNLILQVGHIERFNPAVVEAQKYITGPKFIEANRLGPYDPRTAQTGVVLDLMIHDLDILLFLVGSEVINIDAIGASLLSSYEDIVNARLKFTNGCVANISASRVSLEKFRKIRIFQKDGYISLDYQNQKLKIYQKKVPVVKSLKDIKVIKPRLAKSEPLKEELKHFLNCVQEGTKPLVSGEEGRDALQIGLEILKKIELEK